MTHEQLRAFRAAYAYVCLHTGNGAPHPITREWGLAGYPEDQSTWCDPQWVRERCEAAGILDSSPSVWCSECKGTNVQHLDWVLPNDGQIVGDISATWREFKNNGESYCCDCEDHTLLTCENPNERTD